MFFWTFGKNILLITDSFNHFHKPSIRLSCGWNNVRKTARKLFRMEMSEEQIKEITELSLTELEKIKEELDSHDE